MLLRNRTEQQMSRTTRAAFTLMEMLVVVAIIVALAGVGVVGYISIQKSNMARIAATKAKSLHQAAKAYAVDHGGRFPGQLQDLLAQDQFGGPYVDKQADLLDPWGQPYSYVYPGSQNGSALQPDVWSTGPDGNEWLGNK